MTSKFAILDFETGGLDYKLHPVTQVGLIIVEPKNFAILDQYETFVKPYSGLTYTKEALQKSRVTMEEINSGVDVKKVLAKLIELSKKHTSGPKSKPILVGHNLAFDLDFAQAIFDLASKHLYDFFSRYYYDTMEQQKIIERKSKTDLSFNLTACCERYGIKLKAAHGAMPDVLATRQLMNAQLSGYSVNEDSTKSEKMEERTKSRKTFELP